MQSQGHKLYCVDINYMVAVVDAPAPPVPLVIMTTHYAVLLVVHSHDVDLLL